jgi:hypothetical protein
MSQLNLSTSNFDRPSSRPEAASATRVAAWVAVSLVAIDALINLAFAYPIDPKITNPSWVRAYFEYGRSVEGKLERMTRTNPSDTAPITLTGWYDPLRVDESPSAMQRSIVTFYGMSHAVRLAYALARTSNRFSPRVVGAPGATANWSYGAYLRDRGGGKSRAVVLALMSANLPMITTMSPMTWNLDFPMPYTADKFYLDGGQLKVVHPPFTSFEQFVQTFMDPKKWGAACSVLAKNDSMYNSFIMRGSIFDQSSLFRLIRRAYGQFFLRGERRDVLDRAGFRPESEQVQVARALVREFARRARSDGVIPVVFMVNNLGYSDFLYQALRPALEADNIPYLSSHTIVSPSDPRGYLPDSHFTDTVDDKLARALADLIDSQ